MMHTASQLQLQQHTVSMLMPRGNSSRSSTSTTASGTASKLQQHHPMRAAHLTAPRQARQLVLLRLVLLL
jgi:hypothetical protein